MNTLFVLDRILYINYIALAIVPSWGDSHCFVEGDLPKCTLPVLVVGVAVGVAVASGAAAGAAGAAGAVGAASGGAITGAVPQVGAMNVGGGGAVANAGGGALGLGVVMVDSCPSWGRHPLRGRRPF